MGVSAVRASRGVGRQARRELASESCRGGGCRPGPASCARRAPAGGAPVHARHPGKGRPGGDVPARAPPRGAGASAGLAAVPLPEASCAHPPARRFPARLPGLLRGGDSWARSTSPQVSPESGVENALPGRQSWGRFPAPGLRPGTPAPAPAPAAAAHPSQPGEPRRHRGGVGEPARDWLSPHPDPRCWRDEEGTRSPPPRPAPPSRPKAEGGLYPRVTRVRTRVSATLRGRRILSWSVPLPPSKARKTPQAAPNRKRQSRSGGLGGGGRLCVAILPPDFLLLLPHCTQGGAAAWVGSRSSASGQGDAHKLPTPAALSGAQKRSGARLDKRSIFRGSQAGSPRRSIAPWRHTVLCCCSQPPAWGRLPLHLQGLFSCPG